MHIEITKCRICDNEQLISIFDLGTQCLTGVFPKSTTELIVSGPVELVKCVGDNSCGLVQLKQSYDLSEMYGDNYGYRSGLNSSMVAHLHSKVDNITKLCNLMSGDLIVDIGSNDGTTLKRYPKNGFKLVGIDPTGNKFKKYYTDDINLIVDFFSADVLRSKLGCDCKAKVVTSFSMFYDLENPVKFAKEVESVLHEDGIWVFEQSYLPAMLRTNSFDTICQEHLEFYALHQIRWILDKVGMKIVDVELNNINGGSFSVVAAKTESQISTNTAKISEIIQQEIGAGLNDLQLYLEFHERINKARLDLENFFAQCAASGKKVFGIGASTKGNVLLQYFGIKVEQLSMIGEVNSEKFGCFTPGTNIPLVPEEQVLASNPDYLLILPWHFREFFINNKKFKNRTLVFPLPHFEIIYN